MIVTSARFGTKGNGVDDDSGALQKALDTGERTVDLPYTPGGYRVSAPLVMRGGQLGDKQILRGEAGVFLVSDGPAAVDILGSYTTVEGLSFQLGTAPVDAVAVRLRTDLSILHHLKLADLAFVACPSAVANVASKSHFTAHVLIAGVEVIQPRGVSFYFQRSRGHMVLRDARLEACPNYHDIYFTDFVGVQLQDVTIEGTGVGNVTNLLFGVLLDGTPPQGGSWVRLSGVLVDSCRKAGIRCNDVDDLSLSDVETYACFGDGIILDGVTNANLVNVVTRGARWTPGALAGANGLSLVRSERIQVSNVRADLNTWDGVALLDVDGVQLSNVQAVWNQQATITAYGTCTDVTVDGKALQEWKPPASPSPPSSPPSPLPVDEVSAALLDLHNRERQKAGLGPLKIDARLTAAAQAWASSCAALNLLQHGDAQGRITASGYQWQSWSENIAEGQQTPAEVVAAWMSSPGHKADIFGPYVDVGFGRSVSAGGVVFWVCDFGFPR